ncbi:uncharacterized protein BDR25DRAFT_32807 [Lindgomyces ingoldianus]|uniref:Uncharacterized protein n=1 Tax=Lindgomyces ingoldianus TaxID=673940 RepID=A0ACB6QUV2_9PLEO|nr:uncharacterized protein BDR25DRAFT_32807 [Lindgomyces ingoldianus]KAF2470824.1 hypothetical protein BDR25DRAFT_32807 [Lindgomyces ingoldianus]
MSRLCYSYPTREYPRLRTGFMGSSASVPLPPTLRFTLITPPILHYLSVPCDSSSILLTYRPLGSYTTLATNTVPDLCFYQELHRSGLAKIYTS